MIDGSEVRKRQLAFQLQNLRFFSKVPRGSLEKPRVEEIGILLKACFGSFFNSQVTLYNWFSSLVNNKKHSSFFLYLEYRKISKISPSMYKPPPNS